MTNIVTSLHERPFSVKTPVCGMGDFFGITPCLDARDLHEILRPPTSRGAASIVTRARVVGYFEAGCILESLTARLERRASHNRHARHTAVAAEMLLHIVN